MVYGCADPQPVNGAATQLIGGIATANEADPTKNWGWTSDEQGEWSTNAVCPAGYAMVGMFASGNYSDNVRARCQLVTRTGGWGGITLVISRSFSISDEAPYHNWFMAPYYWTSGASCHNSYCDNMFYWYTTFN